MGYLGRRNKSPFLNCIIFLIVVVYFLMNVIQDNGFKDVVNSLITGLAILICTPLIFIMSLYIIGTIVEKLTSYKIVSAFLKYIFNNKRSFIMVIYTIVLIVYVYNGVLSYEFAFGLFGLPLIVYNYFFKPVRTDRWLYGGNSWGMIGSIVFFILVVFCSFCGVVSLFNDLQQGDLIGRSDSDNGPTTELWWGILSQFSDPGNLPLSRTVPGMWVSIISAFLGIILLSGFLVSSFVNFLSRRASNWKNGFIHYRVRHFDNYVIIIGVNDLAAHIIKTLSTQVGVDYILIQTRQDVEKMRMRLDLSLDKREEDKLVFYYGERTSYEDIDKLHVEKAQQVFILGEDVDFENEKDHDAYNIECLEHISHYIEEHQKKWTLSKYFNEVFSKPNNKRCRCHVNFEYQSTFTAFKATHMYQQLSKTVLFLPFNIHEQWAKKVLVDNFAIVPSDKKGELKVQRYVPFDTYIDNDGIEKGITEKCYTIESDIEGKEIVKFDNSRDCEKTVHFIIMGMNQMGTALATQLALLSHFPNYGGDEINKAGNTHLKEKRRTTITFIDDQAKKEGEYFMGRFASLFSVSRYRCMISGEDELKYSNKSYNVVSSDQFKKNKTSVDHYKDIIDPLLNENTKYSQFSESITDIQWEFIQGNIAEEDVRSYVSEIINDKTNIATIAICFNNPQQTIASALYLPRTIFPNVRQVLVYQQNSFDIVERIAAGEQEWKRYDKLKPFGMVEGAYTESLFDNTAAKVDRFIYQQMKHSLSNISSLNEQITKLPNNILRDSVLLKRVNEYWDRIGIVDKLTSIDAAESLPIRLRTMGLDYTGNPYKIGKLLHRNPSLYKVLAFTEHRRWMVQRLVTGYRPLENGNKEDDQSWCYYKLENNKSRNTEELEDFKRSRKALEANKRAHLDICPNYMFSEVGSDMHEKDLLVICYTQLLHIYVQWLNVLKLGDPECKKRSSVKLLKGFIFNKELSNDFCFINSNKNLQKEDDVIKNHGFWLAKNVVSVKQWRNVTGVDKKIKTESGFRSLLNFISLSSDSNTPVVNVSKKEIEDFLIILRKRTGVYFTLPSLKEWRYAALSTNGYISEIDVQNNRTKNCCETKRILNIFPQKSIYWYHKRKFRHFKKVKDDKPQDMLGNVWEWTRTSDELHPMKNYYICGGSWQFGFKECALTGDYWKASRTEDLRSRDVGFRLIWKFDFENEESIGFDKPRDIRKIISSKTDGKLHEDRVAQIKEWLNNHEVTVESGYFVMGTENKKNCSDNLSEQNERYPDHLIDNCAGEEETPHHLVRINHDFKISSVPVTQALWNLVMDVPSLDNKSSNLGDDYPQTNVNYDAVISFIQTLNELVGEEYRLPTEAEWEYAAKEGHKAGFAQELNNIEDLSKIDIYQVLSKHPYKRFSGSDDPESVAWFNQGTTHKIALKNPNALGIYDMSGNVWEWCRDHYQSNFYKDCISGDITDVNGNKIKGGINKEYSEKKYVTNPECIDKSYSAHVFRGGSWKSQETDCRCTRANYWINTYESNDLGFRIVKVINIEEQ